MRFLSFDKNGVEAVGVRIDDDVVDLGVAAPTLPSTLRGLIEEGLLERAGALAASAPVTARRPADEIRHLPLIPDPVKIFGMGINYGSHVGARPEVPGFFISQSARLTGHLQSLVIPKLWGTLDYEVELGVILGKTVKNVAAGEALQYIAGYTIFNDGSVRGVPPGQTLALHKNSDKTAALGPELVTPDELPQGADGLQIVCRRNGKEVQRDSTSNMFWKVPDAIALLSSYMTLEAGAVIATGTCGGTIADRIMLGGGQFKDIRNRHLNYLRAGEIVECEIEGIGTLSNVVVDEA